MSCVQCSQFPSPPLQRIAEFRSRKTELLQCIFCGQLLEVIAGDQSAHFLSESEAMTRFGLPPGTFAGAVDFQLIGRLSPAIFEILIAELKRGNRIVETSLKWPVRGVFVMLRSDFGQNYQKAGLEFTELNDPHYWRNQYVDTTTADGIGSKM